METTTKTAGHTARLFVLLAAALLALLLLPACGANNDIDQAKAAADGFLTGLEDGDIEAAGAYCATDVSDLLGNDLGIENLEDSFYSSAGLSEDDVSDEVKQSLDSLYDTILKNMITSYDITNVDVDGETATVQADVNWGYDPDALNSIDLDDETESMFDTYLTEHESEIMSTVESEGEDAAMQQLINGVTPQIIQAYEDAINGLDPTESTESLTVGKQDDGSWKVTDIS